jgi:hypothetical protein
MIWSQPVEVRFFGCPLGSFVSDFLPDNNHGNAQAGRFAAARSAPESDSTGAESDSGVIFLFEHDLFGKPVSTFPDHALEWRDAPDFPP